VVGVRGDDAVAQVCDACFETCPKCEGEEFVYIKDDRGYEYARRCPVCGPLIRRVTAFNDAHIPSKYHHQDATLETFKLFDDSDKKRPLGNLQKVHTRIFSWATGYTPGDKGFLLHGKVGTGKTHLLAGVVRYLTLEMGRSARFIEFSHLLSDIRVGFDRGQGEAAVLAPVIDIEVLAIDELGKGRRNDWQLSVIDEIISKRYNRGLTTLFTTNYPIAKEVAGSEASSADFRKNVTLETLEERVGDRIFSRLHEMADMVHIDAPDFRRR
jgi:DNA replication protein DnaC